MYFSPISETDIRETDLGDVVTLVTTLAFALGAAAMLGWYGWKSTRRGRVVPMLILALAMIPLFWQEAPGDWAFFAEYNPNFAHVPHWGPLGATYGGLPVIAIPGYPFYFVPPMVMALALAKRMSRPRGWAYWQRLLAAGLVVGFLWDVVFEIVATRFGIWRESYTPWGLTLWGGTRYQMTVAVSLVIAPFCMWCTYLIGRLDDRGDDVVLAWARRNITNPRTAGIVHFVVLALWFQVVYAISMIPIFTVHLNGLVSYRSPVPLFGNHSLQGSPAGAHDGPLGFLILVGGLALIAAISYYIVSHLEARLSRGRARGRAADTPSFASTALANRGGSYPAAHNELGRSSGSRD